MGKYHCDIMRRRRWRLRTRRISSDESKKVRIESVKEVGAKKKVVRMMRG